MLFIIAACLLLSLLYGPQLWVRHILKKHSINSDAIPGNGRELANHLLEQYGMNDFSVEITEPNQDHFDPIAKTVRLSPDNYHGRSITAIAVATHEVGHAIQCFRNEKIFRLRKTYLPFASLLNRFGGYILIAAPALLIFTKSPTAAIAIVLLRALLLLISALTYLLVLPEEWDASFTKAMPILEKGSYLTQEQLPAARQVLKAAAFTYFAAALTRLLSFGALFRLLRR